MCRFKRKFPLYPPKQSKPWYNTPMNTEPLAEKPLPKDKQKFVAEYVQDGNGTKAVQKAFKVKNANVASNKSARLLGNARIQDAIQKALPDALLAKVHTEGLKATTWYSEGIGKGESVLVEKPDYGVRHRYLDTAYKIKQKYIEPATTTNVFIADQKIIVLAKEYEEKLNALQDGK